MVLHIRCALAFAALALALLWPPLSGALGAPTPVGSAVGTPPPLPARTELRLVVIEAPGCTYCRLLHKRILDAYRRSAAVRDMPVERVDLETLDTRGYGFGAPIRTLPTLVVVREGREVARLAGLPARSVFERFVEIVLERYGPSGTARPPK